MLEMSYISMFCMKTDLGSYQSMKFLSLLRDLAGKE